MLVSLENDEDTRFEGLMTRLASLLLLLTLSACHANASDATPLARSYIRTDFTVDDGLPSNLVYAIQQTRSGFLWIGGKDGLARFDGRRFQSVDFLREASPSPSVFALAEAPDGALWVGVAGGVARIPKESFDHAGTMPSVFYKVGRLVGESAQAVRFTRNGALWVATDAGLYRFESGKFVDVLPGLWISRIEEALDGRLFVITSRGFVELNAGTIQERPEIAAELGVASNEVFHAFEDRSGVMWLCTMKGVARRTSGGVWERVGPYGVTQGLSAYRADEDAQGNIWFTFSDGLHRTTTRGEEIIVPNIKIKYVAFDRDGNVWIGTNGAGLIRLSARRVRMFTSADGLPAGVPMAVLSGRDGRLWVGNNCGGLSVYDGRRFKSYAEKEGLLNSCVFSLAEDGKGDIWVGTHGGGVFRFRDSRFEQISKPDNSKNTVALAIVAASKGSVWVAYTDHLARIHDDGQVQKFTSANGLSSDRVLALHEDRRGVIWVQTSAGIDRYAGDGFVPIARFPEAVDAVFGQGRFGLGEDESGNLFTFALPRGAFHIGKDGLIAIPRAPRITGMVASGKDLWFCGAGIYRADAESLLKWELEPDMPPDYMRLGRADGMNSSQCSGGMPNIAIAADGALWVATEQGVAAIETNRLPRASDKPAIYIEKIVVGKEIRDPGQGLVLPAGAHQLEVHVGVIELSSPEKIQIECRLEGVDHEWQDVGATRKAVYTSVPNGTHQFRVRASNGSGIWDPVGIVYSITQTPHYYETTVFRLAVATVILLCLTSGYRLHLRQIAAGMDARFEERIAERSRVAGELHDTMLQTLAATKLIAEIARGASDPVQRSNAIDTIAARLTQACDEARSAVHALHESSTTSRDDLVEAFKRAAETCDPSSGMTFRIAVEGRRRELHPIVRDELYRIGCEAIRNAYVHSGGTEIQLSLAYQSSLTLRVSDNGRGIDPNVLTRGKAGHYGLRGMQQRAMRIHARLRLLNGPKSGAVIELTVPGKMVFRQPAGDGSEPLSSLARLARWLRELRIFSHKARNRDIRGEASAHDGPNPNPPPQC